MERVSDGTLQRILFLAINAPLILPPPVNSCRRDFMAVCRRWQRLIESSSALWSNVKLLPDSSVHPLLLLSHSQQWLRRTAGLNVTIEFDGDYTSANQGTAPTETNQLMYGAGHFCFIQHIVLPCANRLTSLTCTIGTNPTIRAFFRIPAGSFSMLQHMDILFINQYSDWMSGFTSQELSTFTVFRGVGSLRTLILHLLNGNHPLHLQVPWEQLTILDLGTRAMPPDTARIIIEYSASLVEACFLMITARGISPTLPSRVIARALRVLHLSLIQPGNEPQMLKRLVFPKLVDLRLELEDTQQGWNLEYYIPILRQAKMLQSLSLAPYKSRIPLIDLSSHQVFTHRNITQSEIRKFLKTIPMIVSLRLPLAINISIFVVEAMAYGHFIPLLETLEVGSIHADHIISMVYQRNELVANAQVASSRYAESSARDTADTPRGVDRGPPLRVISRLILLVEEDVLPSIHDAVRAHQQNGSTVVNIHIEPHDPRLFYHPK
ncbi:hypothetical protein CVT25_010624 [Psilocybe cyanescens]|uniref:F-box domain-containing protein n=1 Tax=Psilocybe cyanescens TaxID=93625 RepID=A0A409WK37_PSICY|nr:hypothetical protein CVT25_010624 [Psilocybe cyanescens]